MNIQETDAVKLAKVEVVIRREATLALDPKTSKPNLKIAVDNVKLSLGED